MALFQLQWKKPLALTEVEIGIMTASNVLEEHCRGLFECTFT
jgi:hypothetical protein